MASLTLKPASGGFGSVYTSLGSWALARGATTGTVDTGSFPFYESYNSGATWKIWRGFIPIDTSTIPDGAVIDSATLNFSGYSLTNSDADGNDFVVVVQTTQSNPASLAAADYDNVGTTEGSNRIDVDSVALSFGNNAFTLNATGLSWINKTGVTYFGIREGHDLLNSAVGANTAVSLRYYQDANSPYLTVVYHMPNTGAFFAFL